MKRTLLVVIIVFIHSVRFANGNESLPPDYLTNNVFGCMLYKLFIMDILYL